MLFEEAATVSAWCRARGVHVTIETAATVYRPIDCDLMSLSPKLANSTPWDQEGGRWAATHDRTRRRSDVVARLMGEHDYQLKFVVCKPEDLAEIRDWVAEVQADPLRVILMPEGVMADRLRERGTWVVEACKEYGFRYGPRLHVDLYGHRRGV